MTAGEAPHRHLPRLREPELDGEEGVPEIGLNGACWSSDRRSNASMENSRLFRRVPNARSRPGPGRFAVNALRTQRVRFANDQRLEESGRRRPDQQDAKSQLTGA